MSGDLVLKSSCGGCGTTSDLYGSNCKHMTLCLACGKSMAESKASCSQCGVPVNRLIREYNVRASNSSDKSYSIARFVQGLPTFSRKKGSEAKWFLNKEGLKGRQLTDALRDKYKNKPWILEDETGQYQFQGQLEGAQHATYYLLMMHGKEFLAIPAGAWYNFNKVAQYKQLTLEEAEEKMKNRRRTADGFQRWMMKAANTGAAAFGEVEKLEGGGGGGGGGGGSGGRRKKGDDDDDDTVLSDKAEEDEDEEEERKSRLGLNKRGGDDDEEGARGADLDGDDDDVEKGDDWAKGSQRGTTSMRNNSVRSTCIMHTPSPPPTLPLASSFTLNNLYPTHTAARHAQALPPPAPAPRPSPLPRPLPSRLRAQFPQHSDPPTRLAMESVSAREV